MFKENYFFFKAFLAFDAVTFLGGTGFLTTTFLMVIAGTVEAAAGLTPLDFFVSFLVVIVSFFTSFLAFGFLTVVGFCLDLSGLGAVASLASLKDPAPFLPEIYIEIII